MIEGKEILGKGNEERKKERILSERMKERGREGRRRMEGEEGDEASPHQS